MPLPTSIYLITHGSDDWGTAQPTAPRPELLREGDTVTEYSISKAKLVKTLKVTTEVAFEDKLVDPKTGVVDGGIGTIG